MEKYKVLEVLIKAGFVTDDCIGDDEASELHKITPKSYALFGVILCRIKKGYALFCCSEHTIYSLFKVFCILSTDFRCFNF